MDQRCLVMYDGMGMLTEEGAMGQLCLGKWEKLQWVMIAELCFEGIISEEMAADKLQVSLEEFHSKFEEYKLSI